MDRKHEGVIGAARMLDVVLKNEMTFRWNAIKFMFFWRQKYETKYEHFRKTFGEHIRPRKSCFFNKSFSLYYP